MVQKEYQKRGIHMKKDKLVRNLLDKAAQDYIDKKKQMDESKALVATNQR